MILGRWGIEGRIFLVIPYAAQVCCVPVAGCADVRAGATTPAQRMRADRPLAAEVGLSPFGISRTAEHVILESAGTYCATLGALVGATAGARSGAPFGATHVGIDVSFSMASRSRAEERVRCHLEILELPKGSGESSALRACGRWAAAFVGIASSESALVRTRPRDATRATSALGHKRTFQTPAALVFGCCISRTPSSF